MDILGHKGWIALDIDGTLTDKSHLIPSKVIHYLHELHLAGWNFIFVTGRIFSFAHHSLDSITFPYFIGVQNGADIIEMPFRKKIHREYLPIDIIESVDRWYEDKSEDFIVYGGVDNHDVFYYRESKFSEPFLKYMQKLKKISNDKAIVVKDFSSIDLSTVPLVKCFGKREDMFELAGFLSHQSHLSQTVIEDPFIEKSYFNLITHKNANKGAVIDFVVKYTGKAGPVIGAGNDLNDLALLKRADFSIAIKNSPQQLIEAADFVAPSSDDCGVIEGIKAGILELNIK